MFDDEGRPLLASEAYDELGKSVTRAFRKLKCESFHVASNGKTDRLTWKFFRLPDQEKLPDTEAQRIIADYCAKKAAEATTAHQAPAAGEPAPGAVAPIPPAEPPGAAEPTAQTPIAELAETTAEPEKKGRGRPPGRNPIAAARDEEAKQWWLENGKPSGDDLATEFRIDRSYAYKLIRSWSGK